ncbi:SirB2 family protein [Pelomonas sp. CA6]|uniref:SirB2 family protein n=1 Tax=Pelomonas sp. CA6 TaxID=2907999 RepID=UPI001F4B5327|nr:SirB2 family protein [Pelomonas sp. CA6]MCH7342207.1 SirB2 family protein [Pelomonas sp. CA6]
MTWFYTQMVQMHALLAWIGIVFFLIRGMAVLLEAAWEMDDRVRLLVFGVDVLLVISGLSLWGALQYSPLREGWLAAKLIALMLYIACAHWAMGRRALRLPGYVLGLLALGYVMGVSYTRSPSLGL